MFLQLIFSIFEIVSEMAIETVTDHENGCSSVLL